MKKYEAVIQTLERLGGQATLAKLYREVMKVEDYVGDQGAVRLYPPDSAGSPGDFQGAPGLWAPRSYQAKLGLVEHDNLEHPT